MNSYIGEGASEAYNFRPRSRLEKLKDIGEGVLGLFSIVLAYADPAGAIFMKDLQIARSSLGPVRQPDKPNSFITQLPYEATIYTMRQHQAELDYWLDHDRTELERLCLDNAYGVKHEDLQTISDIAQRDANELEQLATSGLTDDMMRILQGTDQDGS